MSNIYKNMIKVPWKNTWVGRRCGIRQFNSHESQTIKTGAVAQKKSEQNFFIHKINRNLPFFVYFN